MFPQMALNLAGKHTYRPIAITKFGMNYILIFVSVILITLYTNH